MIQSHAKLAPLAEYCLCFKIHVQMAYSFLEFHDWKLLLERYCISYNNKEMTPDWSHDQHTYIFEETGQSLFIIYIFTKIVHNVIIVRFHFKISGMCFAFDAAAEPGNRVIVDSIKVAGEALQKDKVSLSIMYLEEIVTSRYSSPHALFTRCLCIFPCPNYAAASRRTAGSVKKLGSVKQI